MPKMTTLEKEMLFSLVPYESVDFSEMTGKESRTIGRLVTKGYITKHSAYDIYAQDNIGWSAPTSVRRYFMLAFGMTDKYYLSEEGINYLEDFDKCLR